MAEQRSSSRHDSGRDVAALDSNSWVSQRHDPDRGPPPQGPTGRYGSAVDDRQAMRAVDTRGDVHDQHYDALRREHERQLDEDYQAWRRHRFGSEFEAWRQSRRSMIGTTPDTTTGRDTGRHPTEDTQLLFERS